VRVRADGPSLTALGVALVRSRLERPASPSGDAAAEARLVESLGLDPNDRRPLPRDGLTDWVTVRTRFVDDAVVRAIGDGVAQIVLLGAGYDGRALRFRSPGVTFFEVDHPATQADKRERLAAVDASTDGIEFVAADFNEPGLPEALAAHGHDPDARSLVVCEGVLRYLPEQWFRALLESAAAVSAPGSELAATISTRGRDRDDAARRARLEHEQRVADLGEPVLTVPEHDVAMGWLAGAGWSVDDVDDVGDGERGQRTGRLLVLAHR
jgi:methyltransferase (TIGR00027 family)